MLFTVARIQYKGSRTFWGSRLPVDPEVLGVLENFGFSRAWFFWFVNFKKKGNLKGSKAIALA